MKGEFLKIQDFTKPQKAICAITYARHTYCFSNSVFGSRESMASKIYSVQRRMRLSHESRSEHLDHVKAETEPCDAPARLGSFY
jgi:hypothetical protein